MSAVRLFSAGSNARGQLATGDCEDVHTFTACSFIDCPPGDLPSDTRKVLQIYCGANHTIALLERVNKSGDVTRELWGCGDGSKGQLGPLHELINGSTSQFRPLHLQFPPGNYTLKLIAAGWETSYVVLSSPQQHDVLVSFGADVFGDLGTGQRKDKAPGQAHVVEFDLIDCVETSQPYTLSIDSLAASTNHVVAVVNVTQAKSVHSIVFGWGASRPGQLGNTVKGGRPVPFFTIPHKVFQASENTRITAAAVGAQHTVLLKSSSHVLGVGSNRKGQLTGIQDLHDVTAIECTWNGTYAIVFRNEQALVLATGDNNKGQLGFHQSTTADVATQSFPRPIQFPFSSQTHKLQKLACGSEHVLCLLSVKGSEESSSLRSEVWGWGWNEHGNLGLDHTSDIHNPTKIWPISDEQANLQVADVWAGCGTSWILCAG
ncbi:unnamed protein product [Somion occarium]|uniref:RCC1/BLIP-II protein n=1 Tax=Somion occarium TaxID=3059160 RepID=A0ABP1CK19_9APHY